MTYQLTFSFNELQKIQALVDNITLRKTCHDVSFFIDTKDKQITLIGGKDEELERVTLPINAQSTLKRGQWSLNGSYFKDMCARFSARKLPLTLALTYITTPPYLRVEAVGLSEVRTCDTAPVRDTHRAFLDALQTHLVNRIDYLVRENL